MVKRIPTDQNDPGPYLPSLEAMLMESPEDLSEARILCNTIGQGQLARHWKERFSNARLTCHSLDLHTHRQVEKHAPEVEAICTPDFPEQEFDVVALLIKREQEGELTRDLLQNAILRLNLGGRLYVATDMERDHDFHSELREYFPKVTRVETDTGIRYAATKTKDPSKIRDFSSEFAFRHEGTLVWLKTRPGVFSHRKLDLGARALMNSMVVNPGDRVLEIGCGSGAVSIVAALQAKGEGERRVAGTVMASDSHSRAIQCTLAGAEKNGVDNLEARLELDGESAAGLVPGNMNEKGTYDVCVMNPPYFSNYSIAGRFIDSAFAALRVDGSALVVTKTPTWFLERMAPLFHQLEVHEYPNYQVIKGTRRTRIQPLLEEEMS